MERTFSYLHISDFHLGGNKDNYEQKLITDALIDSVRCRREQNGLPLDLIFATGDIAHGGKAEQYQQATDFFERLLAAADLGRERLLVIPGNHDVYAEESIGLERTLTSEEKSTEYFNPERKKRHFDKFENYYRWYDKFFSGIRTSDQKTTCQLISLEDINRVKVDVLLVNSALFCDHRDKIDNGSLWVGRRCVDACVGEIRQSDADIRIALIHHPFDWLDQIERANIKSALRGSCDLVLRGHLHELQSEAISAPQGFTVEIASGACYQTRRYPNVAIYTTVRVDAKEINLYPIQYIDSPSPGWTTYPNLFPEEPNHTGRLPIEWKKNFQI